jgi:exocyst complex protein 7
MVCASPSSGSLSALSDHLSCALSPPFIIILKTIYRSIVSPTTTSHTSTFDESSLSRATATSPEFRTALIRSYSHVVSSVVDRTMDIIELVFFKEAGIGQAAASEMSGASATPRMAVRTAASAAAAGLRILDGVRILGPSLAKLCELSESRTSAGGTNQSQVELASANDAALLAGQLCISIHRTTVKNCARTLENLSKAIQTDPLEGDQYRPPDCRAAPVSSDVVRAIRLMSPFVSAYKSVSKRRYVIGWIC